MFRGAHAVRHAHLVSPIFVGGRPGYGAALPLAVGAEPPGAFFT